METQANNEIINVEKKVMEALSCLYVPHSKDAFTDIQLHLDSLSYLIETYLRFEEGARQGDEDDVYFSVCSIRNFLTGLREIELSIKTLKN